MQRVTSEGFGKLLWLNSISWALPFIPLCVCGGDLPLLCGSVYYMDSLYFYTFIVSRGLTYSGVIITSDYIEMYPGLCKIYTPKSLFPVVTYFCPLLFLHFNLFLYPTLFQHWSNWAPRAGCTCPGLSHRHLLILVSAGSWAIKAARFLPDSSPRPSSFPFPGGTEFVLRN